MVWVKSTSNVPFGGGLLLPLNLIINAVGKKYLQHLLPLNFIINAVGKKYLCDVILYAALIIKFSGSNRPPRGALQVLFTNTILLLGCNFCAGQTFVSFAVVAFLCNTIINV